MWVGLGWTYVMGWVELNFFLPTMVDWIKKSSQPDSTRPMHNPSYRLFFSSTYRTDWFSGRGINFLG